MDFLPKIKIETVLPEALTGVRRAGLDAFHALFGRLADFPIEPNTGTFGLLGRHAVEAFQQMPERHRFFPGLRAWIGFPSADVHYDRQERAAGKPQQTLRRLIRYAADGFFSFSMSCAWGSTASSVA